MTLIRTPALEVAVLPEVGGKIGQIRYRGSEMLIQPRSAYRTVPADRPWIEYDTSGMDDCFPNVDEGPYPWDPWRDMRLPQLGEWVRGTWDVAAAGASHVTLERTGTVLPYRVRKLVECAGERTLRVTYEVVNTGAHGFRYLWSAHPLIAVGETFEVRLPGKDLHYATFPDRAGACQWPWFEGLDVSRQWLPRGRTLKVFVSGLSEGWCQLTTLGRKLRFEFDLAATPFVGLWFNNYGFAGGGHEPFRCIAVEPCTSPTDVLHALPPAAYRFLEAGSAAKWWFSLSVD